MRSDTDRRDADRDKPLDKVKHSLYTIASVIGAIVLFLFAIKALGRLSDAVLVVFVSLFLVFCLRKPVAWFQKHGISRGWGSLLSMLMLFGIIYLIALIVVPPITSQFTSLLQEVPDYVSRIIDWTNSVTAQYSELFNSPQTQNWLTDLTGVFNQWLSSLATSGAGNVIKTSARAGTVAVVVIMALIASFWFLKDLPRMTEEVNVLISPKHATDFHRIVSICSRVSGGYIKGVLIASVCTGVLSGIGFAIAGIPYPVILGAITGIMNIIPIVGPWIAGIIAALVGLFVSPLLCIISIVITVAVRLVTDTLIQPKIMSSAVDLHPGVVIVVLMAGGGIGGVWGMILSVPIAAMIKDIYAYYFERHTKRRLLTEDGALFKGKSFCFAQSDPDSMTQTNVTPRIDGSDDAGEESSEDA